MNDAELRDIITEARDRHAARIEGLREASRDVAQIAASYRNTIHTRNTRAIASRAARIATELSALADLMDGRNDQ